MALVVRHPRDECPHPARGCAVTIGSYDGVHEGHRVVIGELRRRAEARGLDTAVVTFDRHPATVVRPASAPLQLTDLDQEIELLDATGVDHVVVLTFDEERASESAEEFVVDVLVGCLNAKLVIVGEDFHFGHERRGTVALLRTMGAELGFEVEGLALVGIDGTPAAHGAEKVSSTAIRRALDAGDLATANRMLGRPHELRGAAELLDPARRRWRVLPPAGAQLPAPGAYAGSVVLGGVRADVVVRVPDGGDRLELEVLDDPLPDRSSGGAEAARVRFVERLDGAGDNVSAARAALAAAAERLG